MTVQSHSPVHSLAHSPGAPTILVVEDDAVLAMDFEAVLTAMGFAVMGPFGGVEDARSAMRSGASPPDFACLDIHTRDGLSLGLARELVEGGVRTTFVTGQGDLARLSGVAGAGILDKPVSPADVQAHFAPLMLLWARERAAPATPGSADASSGTPSLAHS